MRRSLIAALRMLLVLTVLLGIAYPVAITGIGQGLFGARADGSLGRGRMEPSSGPS